MLSLIYESLLDTTVVPNTTHNITHIDSRVFSTEQMLIISVLNIITASLSALGAGSILLFGLARKKACMAEVFPIFQLSLADLLASSMMISGAALYLTNIHNPLIYGYKQNICSVILALTKCFYINTFLLTLTYALEALLRIRLRNINRSSPRRRNSSNYQIQYVIYVLSWIVPIAATVIVLVMSRLSTSTTGKQVIIAEDCTLCLPIFHYTQQECWLNEVDGLEWLLVYRLLFVVPLIVVMVSNMILYFCIYNAYRKSNISRGLLTYHQRKEEYSIRQRAIIYQSVFACCWVFSLILGLIVLLAPDTRYGTARYFTLYVLQAITAPLQGFCNSLIYGWKRRGFKNAINQTSSSNVHYTYQSISL